MSACLAGRREGGLARAGEADRSQVTHKDGETNTFEKECQYPSRIGARSGLTQPGPRKCCDKLAYQHIAELPTHITYLFDFSAAHMSTVKTSSIVVKSSIEIAWPFETPAAVVLLTLRGPIDVALASPAAAMAPTI